VQLTARNRLACRDTARASWRFRPAALAQLPNSFTPNGDGVNDRWGPGGRGIAHGRLTIQSRWGRTVYSGQGPGAALRWDGTRPNGTPAPPGVYTYRLQVTLRDGRTLAEQGTVTLVR
jgi:gliding motility-associated-like protein